MMPVRDISFSQIIHPFANRADCKGCLKKLRAAMPGRKGMPTEDPASPAAFSDGKTSARATGFRWQR